jgi:hypothetical protein
MVTRTGVDRAEAAAATKRRGWHAARVESAEGWRNKVWAVAAWIVTETKRRPGGEQGDVVAEMANLARDLNGRNGGVDDDGE